MRSSYKRLGDYIREVDVRNLNEDVNTLLGINIDKYYMPSVANVVGTDLSRYKIVKKGQFACNRMHVGRDKRLPVALSTNDESFIVSPAYDVFEITNTQILLSEYLMMWFSRTEFDRITWFYTDADVRGGLSWKTFLDLQFSVPSPEKQREIVAEYNAAQKRIDLNNQLIQKLEETAQIIYKHWFVDFEFPDENGKPYKSNGGEMVESELGEIPKGWKVGKVGSVVKCNPNTLSDKDTFESILYLDTGNIFNNKINELQELCIETDEIPSRARRKVQEMDIIFSTVRPNLKHYGIIKNQPENLVVSTGFAVLQVNQKEILPELIYSFLTDDKTVKDLQAKAEMSVSTYPSITADDILDIDFIIPNNALQNMIRPIFRSKNHFVSMKNNENKKSEELLSVLLSKLSTIEV